MLNVQATLTRGARFLLLLAVVVVVDCLRPQKMHKTRKMVVEGGWLANVPAACTRGVR